MNLYDLIFYIFAFTTIASAFFVVVTKNIIYAAFSLLLTLFSIAGIYVLLGADFLSIIQLIVYVGGIVILILFGVMLTNKITNVPLKTETTFILPATIILGIFSGLHRFCRYRHRVCLHGATPEHSGAAVALDEQNARLPSDDRIGHCHLSPASTLSCRRMAVSARVGSLLS